MFIGRAARQPDATRQSIGQVEHALIQNRDADFEAVGHAVGVAVAEEHVALVIARLGLRHIGDLILAVEIHER